MEWKDLTEYLAGTDFRILIPMIGMFWFFYSRLNGKMERGFDRITGEMNSRFEKVDQRFEKIDQRFEKIDQRFDKMQETNYDINSRLCRIEGLLASKGFFLFESEKKKEKMK